MTKFDISLPKDTHLKLDIFNATGSHVETLINERMAAGNYIITFYAKNLPSGIYFYRVTTSWTQITKKMILIR